LSLHKRLSRSHNKAYLLCEARFEKKRCAIRARPGKRRRDPRRGGHFPSGYHYVLFTPNSRWVVARGRDEVVSVWDAQTGQCLARLPIPGWAGELFFAVSPNSQYLAAIKGHP
jgi:hypothetical protein